MAEWESEAACKGRPMRTFFEDIWPDGVRAEFPVPTALTKARSVCRRCPVRSACFVDCMAAERGEAAKNRHGLFAGLTPLQRASVEKRLTAGAAPSADPLDWLTGWADVPPVPDAGDAWTPRHTRLATDVVRWIVENVELGQMMPQPSTLAREFGRRKADMQRVYDALVDDGTLGRYGGPKSPRAQYVREGQLSASKRWYPAHLTA